MTMIATATIMMTTKISAASVDTPSISCTCCPRACGVNRGRGQQGVCGVAGSGVRLARAALHEWEEPCISVGAGSGAVFFSGCSLHCVYCQNAAISDGRAGKEVSVDRLSKIFLELQDQGAANINLVTPSHYAPQIIQAVGKARLAGLNLPIVYNTSGYDSVQTIDSLAGFVDIFLSDFKYWDSAIAHRYSAAPDYPQVAKEALEHMVRLAGDVRFKKDETATEVLQSGVMVRHLLLPGCLEDSKNIVYYLQAEYGSSIALSLMNQYTPMPGIEQRFPELGQRVSTLEYEQLLDYADSLGVESYYWQEGGAAEDSFIPAFDCVGV